MILYVSSALARFHLNAMFRLNSDLPLTSDLKSIIFPNAIFTDCRRIQKEGLFHRHVKYWSEYNQSV